MAFMQTVDMTSQSHVEDDVSSVRLPVEVRDGESGSVLYCRGL